MKLNRVEHKPYKLMDEVEGTIKKRVMDVAIEQQCDLQGDIVQYEGNMYYVNILNDQVRNARVMTQDEVNNYLVVSSYQSAVDRICRHAKPDTSREEVID